MTIEKNQDSGFKSFQAMTSYVKDENTMDLDRWRDIVREFASKDTLSLVYQQLHPALGYTASPWVWEHPAWDHYRTTETQRSEKRAAAEAKRLDDVADGAFECRKCGGKKVRYRELQMRSGDEGMTRFFRCHACHFTWIQS
jgi:hypothetical protein